MAKFIKLKSITQQDIWINVDKIITLERETGRDYVTRVIMARKGTTLVVYGTPEEIVALIEGK